MALTQSQYETLLADPNLTPGQKAALYSVPQTKEGAYLKLPSQYIAQDVQYSSASGPGLLGFGLIPALFGRPNRSPLGDIAGAYATGNFNISNQSWAAAGYGPGGTVHSFANFTLPALAAPTPYRPPPMEIGQVQPINFLALFSGGYQSPYQIAPYVPANVRINPF